MAHCRRESGRWELYDDQEDRVECVKSFKSKFIPSAAIFIKDGINIINKVDKRRSDNVSQTRVLRSNAKKMKVKNDI